jgi:cobalt-precorrin 5A hydrolase
MAIAPEKPIRVVALTPAGGVTAKTIAGSLKKATFHLPVPLAGGFPGSRPFVDLGGLVAESFQEKIDLVCVMAAGIVVRMIAPHLRSKATDPAVVVLDEKGRFAISLVSGHLGGANALAAKVAAITGGIPVVTTATDVQDLPAFDLIAKQHGMVVEDPSRLKTIHMALLCGETVALVDPDGRLRHVFREYPDISVQNRTLEEGFKNREDPTVFVGHTVVGAHSCEHWLRLRPKTLVIGMGCNKGTTAREVLGLVGRTFSRNGLSTLSIHTMATIEAKREEPGLVEAARRLGVEFLWFPAAKLARVTVPNPSGTVGRHVGTPSVCEAAALLAARKGALIVEKQKSRNATLAVAWEVSP